MEESYMQIMWENENLICCKEGNLQYLQFKRLLQYPEITHCYTLRSNNELNFPPIYKDEEKYKQSCNKICDCLNQNNIESNIPKNNQLKAENIIKPHQTHTKHVQIVNQVENLQEVDGILTNKPNLILLTTSADCISLLLFDPVKKVVGSIHSGWRGTLQKISQNAVNQMVQNYKSNPKDIICCICPSIRECCFEVEEDVKELFYNEYKNLQEIEQIIQKMQIKQGKQKYVIDTVEINKILLKQMGLKEENIIDSNLCTVCHSDKFHSYRKEKELSGRNAAIICKI